MNGLVFPAISGEVLTASSRTSADRSVAMSRLWTRCTSTPVRTQSSGPPAWKPGSVREQPSAAGSGVVAVVVVAVVGTVAVVVTVGTVGVLAVVVVVGGGAEV